MFCPEQLRAERLAQQLTQEELAARMNTTQAHVCRLESGKVSPRLVTLQRWALALGLLVTFEQIMPFHE